MTELTARRFTGFCRDVLETAPKRGNQPSGPKRRIEELTPEALRKRKKTVNALVSILRLAVRMAWENGEITSDRSWRCLRRLPSVDAPRHIFLSRDECSRLIECCPADLANLVRGALYTGCRVSELGALCARDVSFQLRGIHVVPTKNGKRRFVVLPSEGLSFLTAMAKDRHPDERVFTMATGRPWAGGHKHLFKLAVRKAGLPDAFVFHGLRHTYASQLVQAGVSLAIVARQLGHSNTDTVSRTYGHLSIASIEEELERKFSSLHRAALSADISSSLAAQADTLTVTGSWPERNFSSATGPLVQALRHR